jgi:hypothetical protein
VQQENQDLCQPHREHTMPADHSYNPEKYNAQYNNNNNNNNNNSQSAELSDEREDQFDGHGHGLASTSEGDDPKKRARE